MTKRTTTIAKKHFIADIQSKGYTQSEATEIFDTVLDKIKTELLSGNSINLSGLLTLTPFHKPAGVKKVAGQIKGVEMSISISSKTSKKFVEQYRILNKSDKPISSLRELGKMIGNK